MDEASQAKLANYKYTKLTILAMNHNIIFNNFCLRYGIVPKYVNVLTKTRSTAGKKSISIAQKVRLKERNLKTFKPETFVAFRICTLKSIIKSM